MATLNTIRDAMRASPFRPFDIKLVDGSRYTVRHPDYLSIPPVLRPREIEYYDVASDGEDFRRRYIDLGLISEVVIPTEAQAQPAAS
jgi:hypothetical protein